MVKDLNLIRKKLIAYLMALGCSQANAEDLIHDVLIKAFEKERTENLRSINYLYLKRMAKNQWLNQKKAWSKFNEKVNAWDMGDNIPDQVEELNDDLVERMHYFIDKHKFGYIVREMEKRELKHVKYLAPQLNEKAEKLYKRYQKLVRDLKVNLRGGGKGFR